MSQTTTAPSPVIPKKVFARVALVDPDESTANTMHDCFRQFGIRTVVAGADAPQRLQREKFEACVVRLSDPCASPVLQAARSSPSNSRIVIYGIASSAQEVLRFSRFGINAVLDDPVDRQNALKVVRATHLLVVHELRRYVRLPIVAELEVSIADEQDAAGKKKFRATSHEVSAGGMSLTSPRKLLKEQALEVTFALPDMFTPITIRATVCWVRDSDDLIGIRFDPSDEQRLNVKRWIDNYLEIL